MNLVTMIKLKKIADNLSAEEHEVNADAILAGGFDGLSLSYLGSAFGPVWTEDKNYDLSFLRHYRGMKALEVFLPGVDSLDAIVEHTESLSFLSLGEFNKKSISLMPLSGLSELSSLSLVRNKKDFDVIAGLSGLRDLSLTGYQAPQLESVSGLSNLENLYLGFGSFSHLEPLTTLRHLNSLEVLWVKGLNDMRAIEALSGLEFLGLNTLKQVAELPALAKLPQLKSIVMETMNGLTSLSGLKGCQVQELAIMHSRLDAHLFEGLLSSLPELQRFLVALASKKEEEIVRRAMPNEMLCDSLNDFSFQADRRERVVYCQ